MRPHHNGIIHKIDQIFCIARQITLGTGWNHIPYLLLCSFSFSLRCCVYMCALKRTFLFDVIDSTHRTFYVCLFTKNYFPNILPVTRRYSCHLKCTTSFHRRKGRAFRHLKFFAIVQTCDMYPISKFACHRLTRFCRVTSRTSHI